MDQLYLGIDIGGTKCAAVLGKLENNAFTVLRREQIETRAESGCNQTIERLMTISDSVLEGKTPLAVGISCGGPLNSHTGRVLSPPNLPGWDDVPICDLFSKKYGVKAKLQNDANACALAEWKFGAGKGTENMIFLTFGTGMGAGLILGGKLYDGASGMAGEVGHIRLAEDGPEGYGKNGSFEGFCSGGGIARHAEAVCRSLREQGKDSLLLHEKPLTAKFVAEAARQGDEAAREIIRCSAKYLGRGLAILTDLLDPECIVIGSVYARSRDLFEEQMLSELEKETLAACRKDVRIVPAGLGEQVGDLAALCVAAYCE